MDPVLSPVLFVTHAQQHRRAPANSGSRHQPRVRVGPSDVEEPAPSRRAGHDRGNLAPVGVPKGCRPVLFADHITHNDGHQRHERAWSQQESTQAV